MSLPGPPPPSPRTRARDRRSCRTRRSARRARRRRARSARSFGPGVLAGRQDRSCRTGRSSTRVPNGRPGGRPDHRANSGAGAAWCVSYLTRADQSNPPGPVAAAESPPTGACRAGLPEGGRGFQRVLFLPRGPGGLALPPPWARHDPRSRPLRCPGSHRCGAVRGLRGYRRPGPIRAGPRQARGPRAGGRRIAGRAEASSRARPAAGSPAPLCGSCRRAASWRGPGATPDGLPEPRRGTPDRARRDVAADDRRAPFGGSDEQGPRSTERIDHQLARANPGHPGEDPPEALGLLGRVVIRGPRTDRRNRHKVGPGQSPPTSETSQEDELRLVPESASEPRPATIPGDRPEVREARPLHRSNGLPKAGAIGHDQGDS